MNDVKAVPVSSCRFDAWHIKLSRYGYAGLLPGTLTKQRRCIAVQMS